MMTVEIKCDGCGADLTYTNHQSDYRLTLQSVEKPLNPKAESATDMMIDPPLQQDHHFCGLLCLDRWRTARPSW